MEEQVKAAVWRPITPFLRVGGAGLLAAVLLTLSVPYSLHAAAGDLDRSFGRRGRVVTNLGGSADERAHALVLQPDGKIVAAGQSNGNFALARYNPDGSLDHSFGRKGKVRTDFGGYGDGASALVLQPDGKIVAAGQSFNEVHTFPPFNSELDFALARYHGD